MAVTFPLKVFLFPIICFEEESNRLLFKTFFASLILFLLDKMRRLLLVFRSLILEEATFRRMPPTDLDERFMHQALRAAEEALSEGEIPVGAVLVCSPSEIFTAYNLKECQNDPTAHAEILALRAGAQRLGRWRLGGTLYTTLEPCVMCAGALLQARIDRLVFGATDPKGGGCGSVLDVLREPRFNHKIEVSGGLFADKSSKLLKNFFRQLRIK